jgi:hypothetical protein
MILAARTDREKSGHVSGAYINGGTVPRRPRSNFEMRILRLSLVIAFVAGTLAGCASVSTEVTVFDPAQKFPTAEHVAILFEFPPQPYVKVALIEAQGSIGGTESELLEDARKRARALGADAIVRLAVTATYYPPVPVYDPTYANLFYPRYRYYPFRSSYPPYWYSPFPNDGYRWIGGGDVQTLKAIAIRFTDDHAPAIAPQERAK